MKNGKGKKKPISLFENWTNLISTESLQYNGNIFSSETKFKVCQDENSCFKTSKEGNMKLKAPRWPKMFILCNKVW